MSEIKTEIKKIEIEVGKSFMANGSKYNVSDSYSIGRYPIVSILEDELASMALVSDSRKAIKQALNHFDKGEVSDAVVLLHNWVNRSIKTQTSGNIIMRICSIYINKEGEDVRYLSEETIKSKIHDWSEEGLDFKPFLHFVFGQYSQVLIGYETDIANTLEQINTIKELIMKEVLANGNTDSKRVK